MLPLLTSHLPLKVTAIWPQHPPHAHPQICLLSGHKNLGIFLGDLFSHEILSPQSLQVGTTLLHHLCNYSTQCSYILPGLRFLTSFSSFNPFSSLIFLKGKSYHAISWFLASNSSMAQNSSKSLNKIQQSVAQW